LQRSIETVHTQNYHSRRVRTFASGVSLAAILWAGVALAQVAATDELASRAPDGQPANGPTFDPAISGNGNVVLFTSGANNLVPNDTNDAADLFTYDRGTELVDRVTVATDGTEGRYSGSVSPIETYGVINSNGRYVAFQTSLLDLAGPVSFSRQIYYRDRVAGTTFLASKSTPGRPLLFSTDVAISDNGLHVTFTGHANEVPEGETRAQIYVYDAATDTTEFVSVGPDGHGSNRVARAHSVSNDGRYVYFESNSNNLVDPPLPFPQDFRPYRRDRQLDVTELIDALPPLRQRERSANGVQNVYVNATNGQTYLQDLSETLIAPNDLTAQAQGPSQITLFWSDLATAEQGYQVFRYDPALGQYLLHGAAPQNATSFVDTELRAATRYLYYIRPFNRFGGFLSSNKAGTFTTAPAAPTSPTLLWVIPVDSTRLRLDWTHASNPGNEATGFRVWRWTAANPVYQVVATLSGGTRTYVDTGLAPNTRYIYYLTAFNATGQSAASGKQFNLTDP
jgi:hypothetical protein